MISKGGLYSTLVMLYNIGYILRKKGGYIYLDFHIYFFLYSKTTYEEIGSSDVRSNKTTGRSDKRGMLIHCFSFLYPKYEETNQRILRELKISMK